MSVHDSFHLIDKSHQKILKKDTFSYIWQCWLIVLLYQKSWNFGNDDKLRNDWPKTDLAEAKPGSTNTDHVQNCTIPSETRSRIEKLLYQLYCRCIESC